MYRQNDFFIIKDGAKVLAVTGDNRIFWTIDLSLVYKFASLQEAESFCHDNIEERKLREGFIVVKRMIVQ